MIIIIITTIIKINNNPGTNAKELVDALRLDGAPPDIYQNQVCSFLDPSKIMH